MLFSSDNTTPPDPRIVELEDQLEQLRAQSASAQASATAQIAQLRSFLIKAGEQHRLTSQHLITANDTQKRLAASLAVSQAQVKKGTQIIAQQKVEISKHKLALAQKDETLINTRLVVAELKEALAHRVEELQELQRERAENPLTNQELVASHRQQRELLDTLASTCVCAMCLEPFQRNEAVTLTCGHTFCRPDISRWVETSVRNQMAGYVNIRRQDVDAHCPECRGPIISRSGQVRVYLLEELTRLIQKYDPLQLPIEGPVMTEDLDLELLKRPRSPLLYEQHLQKPDSEEMM